MRNPGSTAGDFLICTAGVLLTIVIYYFLKMLEIASNDGVRIASSHFVALPPPYLHPYFDTK